MRHTRRLIGLGLVLVSNIALAQDAPPPDPSVGAPPPPPSAQALLPNIASTLPGVELTADFGYVIPPSGVDGDILGTSLRGQFLTRQRFGGYASAPFAYLSDSNGTVKALGNVELGGLYVIPQGNIEIILRGGVSLPTGPDSGDSLSDIVTVAYVQAVLRPSDEVTSVGGTWGRAHAQARTTLGDVQLGGSVGVDVPIAGGIADANRLDGVVNLAASGGYVASNGLGLGAGVTALRTLGTDSDDKWAFFLQANASFQINPTLRAFGLFTLPDLENAGDSGYGIGAGIQARL